MNGRRERTHVVLPAVVMAGLMLARVRQMRRLKRPVHGADDEMRAGTGGGIGHPADRQKRAQEHRDQRDLHPGKLQRPRHKSLKPRNFRQTGRFNKQLQCRR